MSWDVIVIGSGPGGAAAAYRLASAGLRVLVLEKGARLPRDGSTLDARRVVTQGEFLSREAWSDRQGNALRPEEHFNLGGKSKWYGAAVLRFSAREFAAEPEFRARGWPLRCEDLAPYYAEAERLLGVRTFPCEPGLRRILAALVRVDPRWDVQPLPMALSPEIIDDPIEAAHFDGFASARGLKGEAERSFLSLVESAPNLTLRCSAEVAELVAARPAAAGSGPRISGVRLRTGEVLEAADVILAAGALHSPRLLARCAAREFPSLPALNFGLIGAQVKFHVLTALVAVSLSRQSDPLRKTMVATHASYPHSSVQPLGFDAELLASFLPRCVPRALARQIARRAYGFFLLTEDGSHRSNRVVEQGGERILDYDVRRMPASLREHQGFVRALQQALLRSGFLSVTQRTGANGTAHACGTLMAGDDPRASVVDASGRVHGLAGLYVADGSVLPRSGRVNPSLTIYAWGLRVAARLLDARGAASTCAQ